MRVATDIGGTFTDLVYLDENGRIGTAKSDTTPPNFEQGVMDVIKKSSISPETITDFIHGTTVIINALTERKGVKTGLITTKGFRDVLEIARGNRPDLFNVRYQKPTPFVPRYLRHEVSERLNYKGEVICELAVEEVKAAVEQLRSEGVEAIAVSFLHAYANPSHEKLAVQAIKEVWPEVAVTASHEVTKEWREYERTSTAVLNAYVKPIASSYIDQLDKHLQEIGVSGNKYIMQSNSGTTTFEQSKETPINMVESGPVAGIFGAAILGKILGEENIIAFDIGGTTAKCSLIDHGEVKVTTEYKIERDDRNAGYPIKVPVVDIVEIGNGGGSIAWIDDAGSLKVGPQSAGAMPGPVAYGRGGENPTTTDANLVTGRLSPKNFKNTVNMDAVKQAIEEKVARHFGISVEEAALGIIRIANSNMLNALKLISVRKGYDPREFSLVAFGGGGPMHALALARELGVKKVIIPIASSVFSAWGMLMTDLRHDYIQTYIRRVNGMNLDELNDEWSRLEEGALQQYAQEGIAKDKVLFVRYADIRYVGQEHAVKVPVPNGRMDESAVQETVSRFHDLHEKHYTFKLEGAQTEIVNLHLTAFGLVQKPEIARLDNTGDNAKEALKEVRPVLFEEHGWIETNVYSRDILNAGSVIEGPAIVEEQSSSTVIEPGQQLVVDEYGNLIIDTGCNGMFEEKVKRDQFTLEIVKDSLIAIGEEMFHTLARTSMSPIIYEVLDFASGLTDAKGQLLTQGNGVTGFIGMLTFMVKQTLEKFGKEGDLKPGDILIINDPYGGGGSHLSDVGLVMPIFHEGKLVAFSANKAHWTEVGGKDPGSWTTDSTEIFQEGLQFPCVKLFDEGKLNQPLVDIIAANVRFPELSLGDMWAQVAALRTGEKRFRELCDKYGRAVVMDSIDHLLNHGEQLARKEIAKLPKGTFEAKDFIDDDGIGNGPFHVQVKVTITDDEFICDFRGSHPQVLGPVNCSYTALVSAVRVLFLAVTNPSQDVNDGVFRPLRVIADDRSIFSAERPAAVSTYWETMLYGADLVWKALAPVVPHRLNAGHLLSVCGVVLSGIHQDTNEPFLIVEPSVGGWGAGEGLDGAAGQFCIGDGETYNVPVEVAETRYGVMIDEYSLRTDGAGAGEYRGGSGAIRSYRAMTNGQTITATFGRHKFLPWGFNGGHDGSRNEFVIVKANGEVAGPFGKFARFPLNKGDVVRLITATGGGYGNPLRRPAEKVALDAKNGYISVEQARDIYGVIVNPRTFEVEGITSARQAV